MRNKHLITISFLAALMMANAAFALTVTPENGWWVNPSRSGTGFNIETQNNVMFVATFVYDEVGQPIWYSGSGRLDVNGTVTIRLFHSEGGPCIGCPYQAPTTTDAGVPITLKFTSREEGTASWLGKQEPIQRFNYNLGEGVEKLLGTWALQIGPNTNGFFSDGDQLTLKKIMADGSVTGGGTRPNIEVVGNIMNVPYKFKYYFIENISSINKMGFMFNFNGLNKIEGRAVELYSNDPTLEDLISRIDIRESSPFQGFRLSN